MKPPYKVPDYYPHQLELEEQYYDQINAHLSILLFILIGYFDDVENVSLKELMNIYNDFYTSHIMQLERINHNFAVAIYKLGEQTMSTNNLGQIGMVTRLANDLNVKLKNLMQTIVGRFIALIPPAYVGKGKELYNDEESRKQLIDRSNSSINRYVQTTITAAVAVVLFFNFRYNNYTEYLPDNMHDNLVRDSHRKYNDGKTWYRFDNPPPCNFPGIEWNCLVGESSIQFANQIKGAFRRWYSGKTVSLTTETGNILKSTLNHPILTDRGWILANDLQVGDYLAEIDRSKSIFSYSQVNNCITTISDIFNSLSINATFGLARKITSRNLNFHGELVIDENIDIIFPNSSLSYNIIKNRFSKFKNFLFASSNNTFTNFFKCSCRKFFKRIFTTTQCIISFFSNILFFFERCIGKSYQICFTNISNSKIRFSNKSSNSTSGNIIFFRKTQNTHPSKIIINQSVRQINFFSESETKNLQMISYGSIVDVEDIRNFLNGHSLKMKFSRLTDKKLTNFSGHVYNLHTEKEFYVASNIITHNCRCYYKELR